MKILAFPQDARLLRRVARPVREDEFSTPPLIDFARTLEETMIEAKGAGLAATQVPDAPGGAPGGCSL